MPRLPRVLLPLFCLLLLPVPSLGDLPDHGLAGNDAVFPPLAVAADDGLLGLYHNPASLAFRPGEFGLLYLQGMRMGTDQDALKPAFESRFTGNWSLALGGPIALGLDHVSLPSGYDYGPGAEDRTPRLRRGDRYNLGLSHRFDLHGWRTQIAIGAAYRFTRSNAYALDGLSTWDIGAVLRWRRWVSLGLHIRNTDRPALRGLEPGDDRSIAPSYTFGLALRPKRHWATLSFDVTQFELENGWDYSTSAGLDMDLSGRARVRLDWRSDSRFSLGLYLSDAGVRGGLAVSNQHEGSRGTRHGAMVLEWRNRRFGMPLIPDRHFLDLELSGPISDAPAPRRFGAERAHDLRAILDLIGDAVANRDVKGILIRLDSPGLGLAQREELRRALLGYRRVTGRPVVVYADSYGIEDYYLATAGSRVLLNPVGAIRFTGLRRDRLYFRDALDKLGIQADLIQQGRYKSAPESFTRTEASPAAHEADSSFVAARYMALTRGIAEGRNLPLPEVPLFLDRGVIPPSVALEIDLVDALVHPSQIREHLATEEDQGRLLEPERLEARELTKNRWGEDRALALIHVDGILVTGRSGHGLLGPETGAATVVEALRAARLDPRIRGVLMRVNSGGGGVLASEIIRREIMATRDRKPVVVSFGEAGASGAYLLGMEADHVLCNRHTLTGSIGVWGGKLVFGGLLEKLGIGHDGVSEGRHARSDDPFAPYDEEARRQVQEELDRHYRNFVGAVAARRRISEPEVDLIGRGRIWGGVDAIGHGLVDELGGMREGLAALRRLSSIPPGDPIEIVRLPERPSLIAMLRGDGHGAYGATKAGLLPAPGEDLTRWLERLEPYPSGAALALEPAALPPVPAAMLR